MRESHTNVDVNKNRTHLGASTVCPFYRVSEHSDISRIKHESAGTVCDTCRAEARDITDGQTAPYKSYIVCA